MSSEMSSELEAGLQGFGGRARSRRRGAERHPPWGETEFIRLGGGVFFSIGAAGALTERALRCTRRETLKLPSKLQTSNFEANFELACAAAADASGSQTTP